MRLMDVPTYSGMDSRSQPRTFPCSYACTHSVAHESTHSVTEFLTQEHMHRQLCPRGYSCMQIAILSVLRSPHEVLAYWQIAELLKAIYGLEVSEGAVRGAIERLARYKMLVKERSALGHIKGNRYAFKADPCPHIPSLAKIMESPQHTGTDSHTQLEKNATSSILDKIDRKNLSISSNSTDEDRERLEALSEEDIAFNWPELAQIGFGTIQIRQIVEVRGKEQDGLKNIVQGLTYADWEFAHHGLRTKKGEEIKSPLNWIFSILLRQGYYPRPAGYISPEEQADLDRTAELVKQQEAREVRLEAEYKEWLANCTIDERKSISSQISLPEKAALRRYFVENIWPKILCESRKEAE